MLIRSFEFQGDSPSDWAFSKYRFKPINLFVGATGSGKTRFLNTLFNIGRFVATDAPISPGRWEFCFSKGPSQFRWELKTSPTASGPPTIESETLSETSESGLVRMLVERTQSSFRYQGKDLPKLSITSPSLFLLRDEEEVAPLHYAFAHIMRRSFSEQGLSSMSAYQELPAATRNSIKKSASLQMLFEKDFSVSAKLAVMKDTFRERYDRVIAAYKSVFPNIEKCEIVDLSKLVSDSPISGDVPAFAIKEKGVSKLIPVQELSSGMQKVLLIMTDIVSLPAGSTYLVDEYENSLGVNAIDFLPSFLVENAAENQFIITTHHPYLINNVPVENWGIFNRSGSRVTIKSGEEYSDRFKRSKQQAFVQLINDQFFAEGTE